MGFFGKRISGSEAGRTGAVGNDASWTDPGRNVAALFALPTTGGGLFVA